MNTIKVLTTENSDFLILKIACMRCQWLLTCNKRATSRRLFEFSKYYGLTQKQVVERSVQAKKPSLKNPRDK